MGNPLYLSYDGDGCGKKVGRAIIANDEDALHEISAKIDLGHEIVKHWVAEQGGKVISGGGDEGAFKLPKESAEHIEELRADYNYATGITISVGVGSSLSEAGRALLAAKFRGKDQIAYYDNSVEKDIKNARKRVKKGTASQEEVKLADAYLEKADKMVDAKEVKDNDQEAEKETDDCQYCNQVDNADPNHCKYCHDIDAKENEEACPYCAESGSNKEEPTECPYCKESENKDECPYCKESGNAEQKVDGENNEESQENIPEEKAHSKEAMQAIAQKIEGETVEGQPEDKEEAKQIDDTAIVGDDMEGNISRPEGFDSNSPGDMGTDAAHAEENENDPDISMVLQESLEDSADDIQKEKVREMVGQALSGFKNSKQFLEASKNQSPEFYSSCIAMLAAMIHMAGLLGLRGEGNLEAQPETQPEAKPEENEWSNPFPTHPDQGGERKPGHAAGQEAAAQPPQQ